LLSINEIKRRLPKEFIDELYEVYTPVTVDKILTGMSDDDGPIKYNSTDAKFFFENEGAITYNIPRNNNDKK